MAKDICTNCDLYKDGYCTKYQKDGGCSAITRDYFDSIEQLKGSFITVEQTCRKCSIFGNFFIGLSLEDIERIKNGEIVHIPDEYGIFIGLKGD